jgi:hypothetical protein
MAVVAPYLIGVVTAPLVARVFRPLLRGAVKTTVGVALEAKRAAAEVREEFQDIAAEATVERAAADEADRGTRPGAATKATGATGVSRGADVTR